MHGVYQRIDEKSPRTQIGHTIRKRFHFDNPKNVNATTLHFPDIELTRGATRKSQRESCRVSIILLRFLDFFHNRYAYRETTFIL